MGPVRQKKLTLRVATYNIHKCRGLDGKTDIVRIASVLKPLKADIIALQEVVGPSLKALGQDEELAMRLRMSSRLAPARSYRGRLYGNAVLTRLPVIKHLNYDLSLPGHEARVCQRVDVMVDGYTLHIHNVHFGTSAEERGRQAKKLMAHMSASKAHGPKIFIGDFNEWKKGPATELLNERLTAIDLMPHLVWRATYPGILPIFDLDHLYYSGHVEIMELYVPRGWKALMASDHLPMLAELRITVKSQ
jgi:endonuclease/exonuclease/phosphatase family metal-dependent hydrolase